MKRNSVGRTVACYFEVDFEGVYCTGVHEMCIQVPYFCSGYW